MGVVPFKKTGTAPESTAWSWDADTQNAILGDDPDAPNWTRYRDAHTWYDAADDEKKSAYKLPHHAMIDGKLSAVWHGVAAAVARLEQSDIPEGDMKGAFDHLTQHYAQWDKEPPEWDRWIAGVRERRQRDLQRLAQAASQPQQPQQSQQSQRRTPSLTQTAAGRAAALPMVATRAPISVTAARPNGAPTDDDLARINALARSPLAADAVYVFPAEISNQSVDAYYTRMTPKSLQQFAQDATRGVAVCDSHQHYQLPIGRSFYGTVATVATDATDATDAATGGEMATQSLAYMLRGMRTPSGMLTDDIIRGIEGGVNADVSIGFIPDHYWCSICGLDMLNDWDCMHWPGNTYDVRDPKTGVEEHDVLCIADVDARLAEYSLVYDGATPNAMVLKAEAALDSGRALTAEVARQIRLVEDHCRVKLIDRWRGYGSAGMRSPLRERPDDATHTPAAIPAAIPAEATPEATVDKEFDDMRGTEFLARYIETMKSEATRVGKQVSQKNLDRLSAMHDKLSSGHDTMDEAMRELASFIDDVSSGAGGDTDGDGDNPAGGDDPDGDGRAAAAAAAVAAAAAGEPQARAVEIRADGSHDAFTGTHSHPHPAYSSQGGDAMHDEEHTHDGDANHDHHGGANAAFGVELRTAPATGLPNQGVEMPAADGQMREVTLAAAAAAGADPLTPEQRAVFELGQRVLREAQDEAIQWAVRAGVVTTPEEEQRYRQMFVRCSFDEVTTFRQSWEQIAKANLSPRGTWTSDRSAPGGGRWSDAPTLMGGRQTAAADPNDPQRLAGLATRRASASANGRSGVSSVGGAQSSRASDDASLYTVGGGKRRAGSRAGGK
ncbi:MAG TPA: hypothetical protein VE338_02180 [Ktedonobacterales bacterium]|nr:hypothetical protein [Ktedonobacterales bacterium]